MFFTVRIVSKSPAKFSTPIGAFMELRSNVNLPCLVNLALNILSEILVLFGLFFYFIDNLLLHRMVQNLVLKTFMEMI